MMGYKHTQIGYALIVILTTILVLFVALGINFIVVVFLWLIAMANFLTLTVNVQNGFIEIIFGIGIIRKKIALQDVASCKSVRNPWYYSLAIHMIPNGWIYNVSGLGGVELIMKNGKIIRIGSDEPQALETAIKQASQ